jgi:DNA-binding transcriptional LysR family regulator
MSELAGIELNLLVALDHLLETESVTSAARRAGTSQPSMSRTLSRLRAIFGDPLLVASGRGMLATERGRELAPRVRAALAAVRQVLAPREAFDPGRDRFVCRIAASDLATATVVGPALDTLRREAPGMTLRIEPATPSTIDALVRGDVDLAIAPRRALEGIEQLVFRPLMVDPYVCAVRSGHAASKRRLTLARYLALDHLVVSRGTPGVSPVQATLQRLGKTRRVAVSVPSFHEAACVVATSDLAAVLPERFIQSSALPLCARPLPFQVEPFELFLAFHPRSANDRRQRWVRAAIAASARKAIAD